jgi:hypothetical protein
MAPPALAAALFGGLGACSASSPSVSIASSAASTAGQTATSTSGSMNATSTGAGTNTGTNTNTSAASSSTTTGTTASSSSVTSTDTNAGAATGTTTDQDASLASGGDGGATTTGAPEAGAGDAGAPAPPPGGDSGPAIVDLFNGTDLTGFNTYQETSNTTAGVLLTGAAAEAIFQPENGMIHVYGDLAQGTTQVHYLLETVASYSKYSLTWQYQWGTKKFAPYTDLTTYPRDAGVLWHIHNDKTQVWPSSIEFQNKWGTTGDIFALYAQCTSLGTPGMPTVFAEADAGGVAQLVNGSNGYVQHSRSADWEMMGDGGAQSTGAGTDWNSCLLQVDGGTAVYTVNGHVVNRVLKVMDKNGNPVTSGPIGWQAEQAEVYYRNLQIQVFQ